MKAKYEGRCVNCGGRIGVGDEIVRARIGWQHDVGDGSGCPADPQELTAFATVGEVLEEVEYEDFMHDCGDR